MSEFINVTEVEKLPINKIDSLIAIDDNKNIKRAYLTIDQEVIPESTNPVSSKGVYDIIVVLGDDFGEAVSDLENHIGGLENDITDVRDEIIELSESIGVDVEKFVLSGDLGWQEISNLQFTTGDAVNFASRMSNGQQCDLTILLNGEMALTPTTTVVENGNVGILLIMGVDVYSIYVSADGEIVPEFLAAIPSDYYTRDQVYNKTQIDIKLENIDQRFGDYYTHNLVYTKAEVDGKMIDCASINYVQSLVGDINAVLDQINGEEV